MQALAQRAQEAAAREVELEDLRAQTAQLQGFLAARDQALEEQRQATSVAEEEVEQLRARVCVCMQCLCAACWSGVLCASA